MKIEVTRPHFPEGYMRDPQSILDWEYIQKRMQDSLNYWVGTASLSGKPHIIPVWGVWLDDRFYFDGDPKTRHAKNIKLNPKVTVNLESGSQVVILHGEAKAMVAQVELGERIAAIYTKKYAGMGYEPEPDQWLEGGLYQVTPHKVIAWSEFSHDPTRFHLTW